MDGGSAMYPERELWVSQSHITGVTGSPVRMADFLQDRGSFLVSAPPGLAAAVTVSFETADADPAQNYCAPLATWTKMQQGGLCDTPTDLTVVIDPTDTTKGYSTTAGQICRVPLQCRSSFVRAVLSAATPGLTVHVIGKASRLHSL